MSGRLIRSADDGSKASNDATAFTFPRPPPDVGSDHSARHRNTSGTPADQTAKVDTEDVSDRERNEAKLAVLDHTLALSLIHI